MTCLFQPLRTNSPLHVSFVACCHNYNLTFCLFSYMVSVSYAGSFLLNVWSMYITLLAPPGILLEKQNIWSCPYTINLLFNNDPVIHMHIQFWEVVHYILNFMRLWADKLLVLNTGQEIHLLSKFFYRINIYGMFQKHVGLLQNLKK